MIYFNPPFALHWKTRTRSSLWRSDRGRSLVKLRWLKAMKVKTPARARDPHLIHPTPEMAMKVPASTLFAALKPLFLKVCGSFFFIFFCFFRDLIPWSSVKLRWLKAMEVKPLARAREPRLSRPTLEMAMKVPASTLITALKPPLLKVSFFSFLCFCDCHCWSWFLRRAWIWEEIGVFLNLCVFLRWLWVNYWKPSCMLRFWLRFFLICKSDTTLASFSKLIGRELHPNELEFLFS